MRKLILLFFLIPITCLSQNAVNQTIVDSLLIELPKAQDDKLKVDILNNISVQYIGKDIAPLEKYAKQALEMAQKIEYKDGMAYAIRNLGIVAATNTDFKTALMYYDKALECTTNKKIRGQILGSIGKVYSAQANFPKAIDYLSQSLLLFEDIEDKKLQTVALSNLSTAYLLYGDIEKYKFFKEKSVLISQLKSIATIAMDDKKENCLENSTETSKAIDYYENKLKAAATDNNKIKTSEYLMNESVILLNAKNTDKALENLKQSLVIEKQNNNGANIAINYHLTANAYLDKAKLEMDKGKKIVLLNVAISYLKQSLILCKKLNLLDQSLIALNKLSQCYELRGDYNLALEAYKAAMQYKDSIFNQTNKETIKNIEDKRTIDLKNKEIQLNKVKLEVKEKQRWFYIIGISFLAILGGLLFFQSQVRKKTNQKLQVLNSELDHANRSKIRFFGILNHDLRSPVANLISFLRLQKESPEMLDAESSQRLQDKTMTGAVNLLNSMEDILQWSKSQMSNFKPQPKTISINNLFEDTKNHFSSIEKVNIFFENPENLEIKADENYLKTIIRNLTGNAIKASNAVEQPTIIWKAWQENKEKYLSISDNGKGGTQEAFKALYDDTEITGIKTGLGLHLIRDLAKVINCKISVVSIPNTGTTFKLLLNNA
jgi:signal transduction histidine kinase/Tfp pilus assembly protein PilF